MRNFNLDILRIFASIAVIMIHVSAQNWSKPNLSSFDWNIFNIYDSMFRWAVPVFVMISGALFLGAKHSISVIWKKYISRLAIIFICWSIIYAIAIPHGLSGSFIKILKNIITGHFHMWYLLMLIGIYMAIPILQLIVNNKKITRYYLIGSLILYICIPTIITAYKNIPINIDQIKVIADNLITNYKLVDTNIFCGYAFYFVLGYYLNKKIESNTSTSTIKNIGLISIFLGYLLTVILTFIYTKINHRPFIGFYTNNMFNVVLESLGVFILIRQLKYVGNDKLNNLIVKLSQYTLGIFLVHPLVLTYLNRWFDLNTLSFNPIFSIPIIFIITYAISLIITLILKQIPIIKKIV